MKTKIQKLTSLALTGAMVFTMSTTGADAISPKEEKVEALMIELMKATEGKDPVLYEEAKKSVEGFKRARQLEKEAQEAHQTALSLKKAAEASPGRLVQEDFTMRIKNFIAVQTGPDGNIVGHHKAIQIINETGPELDHYLEMFTQEYPEYRNLKVYKR